MQTVRKSVSIDGKLYNELKEYCALNGLRITEFAESLIRKSFTYEKFGDIPFGTLPEPSIEPVKAVVEEKPVEAVPEPTVEIPQVVEEKPEVKNKPKKIRLN